MWLVVLAALRTVSSKRLAFQHTADKQSNEILHYEQWDKPNVLYSSRFCRTCAKPSSRTGTQLVFQLIRTSARISGHGRLPTSEQAMKKQLPLSRQAVFFIRKKQLQDLACSQSRSASALVVGPLPLAPFSLYGFPRLPIKTNLSAHL
jgi:hypothetical protein